MADKVSNVHTGIAIPIEEVAVVLKTRQACQTAPEVRMKKD